MRRVAGRSDNSDGRAILQLRGETDREVWVLDSFEGCPSPREEAEAGDRHWGNNLTSWRCRWNRFNENCARYGMLDDRVVYLKGWFSDTLPNAPIERLAVLRIDADMYSSTTDALNALYHKLAPGAYVIVDDYYTIHLCRQAVDEFRIDNGIAEPMVPSDQCRAFWQVR